jgi:DNA anti-recombination protein RmuC
MKLRILKGVFPALCLLCAVTLQAQETKDTDKFEKRLKEIQENFDKQQREMRESFEKELREQREVIETLKKQIVSQTNAPAAAPVAATTPAEIKELNDKVDAVVDAQRKERLRNSIRLSVW